MQTFTNNLNTFGFIFVLKVATLLHYKIPELKYYWRRLLSLVVLKKSAHLRSKPWIGRWKLYSISASIEDQISECKIHPLRHTYIEGMLRTLYHHYLKFQEINAGMVILEIVVIVVFLYSITHFLREHKEGLLASGAFLGKT